MGDAMTATARQALAERLEKAAADLGAALDGWRSLVDLPTLVIQQANTINALREAAEWLKRDEVRLVALEEAIHAAMLTNGGETDGDDDWNYVMVRRDAFDRLDARDKEREGRARP
jgi:hypothetical protein